MRKFSSRTSSTVPILVIIKLLLVCCFQQEVVSLTNGLTILGAGHHDFSNTILTLQGLHHTTTTISQSFFSTMIDQHHLSPTNIEGGTSTTSLLDMTKGSTGTMLANINDDNNKNMFSAVLSKYREALQAKPLQTKIMTGGLLAVVGDAIAQSREPTYNFKRAASFVAFDGCWRAVQVFTYTPLIQTCTGQFSVNLLHKLPFLQTQQIDPFLFGAMEQTLVSQLVMIPCKFTMIVIVSCWCISRRR
jgi:hypothetical protein